MKSYITQAELDQILIDDAIACVTAPLIFRRVLQTQMSIARHFGGMNVNGLTYTYLPATDELIRGDAIKSLEKMRKKKAFEIAPSQMEING